MAIQHHKIVGSLPATLIADSVYAVRVGAGFDFYITSKNAPVIAHKVNSGLTHYPAEIQNSGRGYLYNDTRWVTNSDDNYGPNYYQFNENAGTGADPIMEWEHIGHHVEAGTILRNMFMMGRITDANSIADLELIFVYTDPQGRWAGAGTGLDNDGEDAHTILWRGFWKAGGTGVAAFTAPVNDKVERNFPLGDFVVPANGDIRIYYKPVNVDPRPNTSNDYFLHLYKWNISKPLP